MIKNFVLKKAYKLLFCIGKLEKIYYLLSSMFIRNTKNTWFLLRDSLDTGSSDHGCLCGNPGDWPKGIDGILREKRKRIW